MLPTDQKSSSMFGPILEFLAQLLKAPRNVAAQNGAPAPTCPPPSPVVVAPQVDPTQFQQMLTNVSELTTTVAQDVGTHNKSIQAISSELATVAQSDPSAVASIVCKLLVANQELQGR